MKNILIKIRDNHEQVFRVSLFLLTLALIVYAFPRQAKFKYEFTKGKPWMHETIIAPFDFSILKSVEEIKSEKDIINKQHAPIFNFNEAIFEIKAEEFVNLFEDKWSLDKKIQKDLKFTFSNIFMLNNQRKKTKKHDLVNFGFNKLQEIYSKGIIQLNFDDSHGSQVLLKKGSLAEKRDIIDFYTINSAANEINLMDKLSEKEFTFIVPLLLASLEQNIIYDKIASDELLQSELNSINISQGLIIEGQIIVNKGEIVNPDRYQKLLSLKEDFEGTEWNRKSYYLVLFGQIILVGISLLILFLFLRQYRLEIITNTTRISMILSLIVIMVLLSALTLRINSAYFYILPFCISPIILKAFFDNRVALFVHLITILIIGFIAPNGFQFVFLQLIAGIISILTVLKMYKRAQLFISVGKVIGVYFLVYIALSVIHDASFSGIELSILAQFAISGA